MKCIKVPASRSYEVKIGRGLLDCLGTEAKKITQGKVLVVTDENVAPHYLARAYKSLKEAGLEVATFSLPAGEQTKSSEYYVNLLNILAEKNLTRTDLIVALGGGVIGDLTGFAAATYLRGIPFLQVPTTVLSMVDSSVGGKTAIDLPAGKNLVGAFYQPWLVLCDLDTLETLPQEIFRDGCAEIIKTAILFDPVLFSHLQKKGLDFDREYVVSTCVEHKKNVVCADEFDKGERQKLNLGHTPAHGIEKISDFTITHGKAVAIGTAMMSRAYCKDAAAIISLLKAFGLPTHCPFSPEALARVACLDKKRSGDSLTLVVPHGIGACSLEKIPVCQLQAVMEAGF